MLEIVIIINNIRKDSYVLWFSNENNLIMYKSEKGKSEMGKESPILNNIYKLK